MKPNIALTRIWLLFVAAYPIVVGTLQLCHFFAWLFNSQMQFNIVHCAALYSPPILGIFFVVSLRERFCVYHRMCIVTTFLLNINHICAATFIPHALNNYLALMLILITVVGILGSMTHFIKQIQDFIRYVRIESKKQDSYQGVV